MLYPGTVLHNRYQIIQRISGGGMGEVYLAADLRLANNHVVVKENRGGDPQLFYAEAAILAALQHSNLPRVIDHFVEQNQIQYLVMDYIAGQTLEEMVQSRGKLTESETLEWIHQIIDAVNYLHANHIVHRDIKPQNIIVTPSGRAVLVDFGIAKVMQPGQITRTGARGFGTAGYAPPEQYTTTGGTDERSDIYALGGTLYYGLIGEDPPSAPERLLGKPLKSARANNPSVSVNTETVIAKAMALDRNQRFPSGAEMDQALHMQAITTMPSPRALGYLPKWVIWGTIIAILGIGGGIFAMVFNGRGMAATVPPTSIAAISQTGPSLLPTQVPLVTSAPSTLTNTPLGNVRPTQLVIATPTMPVPTPSLLPTWTPLPPLVSINTPTPARGFDCDDPLATINDPPMNAIIRGNQVFQGTANTQDFIFYKVQFMPDGSWPNGSWGELYKNVNRVTSGKLFEWQTGTVAPGGYWLRLLVTRLDGSYGQPCLWHVTIVR